MTVNITPRATGELDLAQDTDVQGGFLPVTFWISPGFDIDQPMMVLDRPYKVKDITARITTLNGSALTATVKKAAESTLISAGTALHSGSIDLNASANANQGLTVSTNPNVHRIARGDLIGVDYSDVNTAAVGCITLLLSPL